MLNHGVCVCEARLHWLNQPWISSYHLLSNSFHLLAFSNLITFSSHHACSLSNSPFLPPLLALISPAIATARRSTIIVTFGKPRSRHCEGGLCWQVSACARLEQAMLEAESCPQGILSPCRGEEDSGEEELAVLPRHTKVIVTGNNRTKSVLVGLHGVVKKAVGLGGWHWLVLTNGLEVKLQRNALSVLEHPTGLEEDGDDSEDLVSCRTNVEDFGKPFKQKGRLLQKPSVSSKPGTRNQMADASSKGLKSSPSGLLGVDFSKLEMAALLRYWRHFNLVEPGPNPSKEQLVDAVERHFMSQQLDEVQVITAFVQAAKRLKTVYG